MDEPSREDDEEAAEIRKITQQQFAMISDDPLLRDSITAMQRQIGWQQSIINERRRVFARLVEIGAQQIPNPFFPSAQLSWLLIVINNAHAIPLPEDRPDIVNLVQEYLDYYAERVSRPTWIPESYAIAAHAEGEWGEMAAITYPMPPSEAA